MARWSHRYDLIKVNLFGSKKALILTSKEEKVTCNRTKENYRVVGGIHRYSST